MELSLTSLFKGVWLKYLDKWFLDDRYFRNSVVLYFCLNWNKIDWLFAKNDLRCRQWERERTLVSRDHWYRNQRSTYWFNGLEGTVSGNNWSIVAWVISYSNLPYLEHPCTVFISKRRSLVGSQKMEYAFESRLTRATEGNLISKARAGHDGEYSRVYQWLARVLVYKWSESY